jgi:hypothetical protein
VAHAAGCHLPHHPKPVTYYDPDKFTLVYLTEDGPLTVPIHFPVAALRGHYEKLTPLELEDLASDIRAEQERRKQ